MADIQGQDTGLRQVSIMDYLIQVFDAARKEALNRGIIVALRRIDERITSPLLVTGNETLIRMKLDLALIINFVNNEKQHLVKEFVKENVAAMDLAPELVDAFQQTIDSVKDLDELISGDAVQGDKLIEKFKPVLVGVPPQVNKEALVAALFDSFQSGFHKVVYVDLPEQMAAFFDDMIKALEADSPEQIRQVLESEKLRWHDRMMKRAL